jgi:RHS repeat-associated protein
MDDIRRLCVVTGHQTAPEALLDGDRVLRLITDHRGSVRVVVDATTGEELQRLDYDPLGRRTIDTQPGFQPFGFAGSVHDAYTGLVHLGRRVLDPGVGRFLTADPLGFEAGQVNVYAYAGNDPVNRHDPSGTQSSSTGTVKVCTAPFAGSRPASADHVFLEGDGWSRGTTFAPDAEGLDRVLDQQWVDETTHPKGSANHPEKECQEVENVDEECLDAFTTPGGGTGPYGFGLKVPSPHFPVPVEINMCATDAWDALDACAGPGGWEYKEDIIDRTTGEGPGLVEAAVRWARDAANYPETIWDWITN